MMIEFRSFIFEKQQSSKSFPIWWVIFGLLALGLITLLLKVASFWSSVLFFIVPMILTSYVRLKDFSLWDKEKLNGLFTGEIVINQEEITLKEKKYPITEIQSITIIYNSVYGYEEYSAYDGAHIINGETNLLKLILKNHQMVSANFKFASLNHAKQLVELTESLKDKVAIVNNWKIKDKT
jgi:hypothetical protein